MERIKAVFQAAATYLREVAGELSKVVWPGWARTLRLTGVVVAMVAVIAGYLFILDTPLQLGLKKILRVG